MQLTIMFVCKDTHVTMKIPNINVLVHNVVGFELKQEKFSSLVHGPLFVAS